MKIITLVLSILISIVSFSSSFLVIDSKVYATAIDPQTLINPSEFIIEVQAGKSISDVLSPQELSSYEVEQLPNSNFYKITLNNTAARGFGVTDNDTIVKYGSQNVSEHTRFSDTIRQRPSVKSLEANTYFELSTVDTSTEDDDNSVFVNTRQEADEPEERAIPTRKIRVAVLDTAINISHPSISSRLLKSNGKVVGYDFANDDGNLEQGDTSHGTSVTGVIIANSNPAEHYNGGLCQNECVVIPIQVCNQYCSSWDVNEGIEFAVANGADVINMSFAGPGKSTATEQIIQKYYREKGTVFVAASGNNNSSSPYYPAALKHVVSVGSIDSLEAGRSKFSNYGNTVDVAAPGLNVKIIRPGTSKISSGSGTSFSSPYAAAIIAKFLYSQNNLRSYQVETIIRTDGHVNFAGNVAPVGLGVISLDMMRVSSKLKVKGIFPAGNYNTLPVALNISTLHTFKWIPQKIQQIMPQEMEVFITNKAGSIIYSQRFVVATDELIKCSDTKKTCQATIDLASLNLEKNVKYLWGVNSYSIINGKSKFKTLNSLSVLKLKD